jgi:hypothetical protein
LIEYRKAAYIRSIFHWISLKQIQFLTKNVFLICALLISALYSKFEQFMIENTSNLSNNMISPLIQLHVQTFIRKLPFLFSNLLKISHKCWRYVQVLGKLPKTYRGRRAELIATSSSCEKEFNSVFISVFFGKISLHFRIASL